MKKIFALSSLFLSVLFSLFIFATPIFAEVDTTPPTGTILINGGALYTNTRDVTLTLSATDDISGVAEMQFNNGTGSYSPLEPYSTTKSWTLSSSDTQLKTVRVKFKDQAGNETTTGIPATINLDTIAPVITLTGANTINLNAGDIYTELGATVTDNIDTSVTVVVSGSVDTSTAGTYIIHYNATDLAGNSATEVTRIIVVTTTTTPVAVHLRIETSSGSIYDNDITVNSCDSEGNGVMKITPYCALVQSGTQSDWSGLWMNSIGGISNDSFYWGWLDNLKTETTSSSCDQENPYNCSAKQYILSPSDQILFFYDRNPLKISADSQNPSVGSTVKFTVTQLGYEGWSPVWNPAVGGKIIIGSNTFDLDADGTYSFLIPGQTSLVVKGQLSGFLDTPQITITPNTSLDTIAPVITLTGANTINLNAGDIYTELGATVTDNIDTSVTVVVSGSVDTSTAGTYIIHYNATDLAGNSATEVTRTIIVSAPNGGGGNPPQATFSTPKAVAYLESTQSSDGSFGGNTRYTDWASIALASNGINNSVKTKILDYLKANNNIDSILTSNERRSMALLALGQNPYSFEGINYIKSITDTFDGTQLGDTNLDNDDIFGLMVLPKVGYTINDDEVSKTISFVLSAQLSNGSWDNSVDMTGASIQALAQFDSVDGVKDALNKASNYLQNDIKDGQQSDGGWSNVSSTSWAMQAQAALGVSWNKNGKTGLDYLATTQLSDGGVLPITETLENRIWATSYAIPGALGKNWANIMQSVVKPEITSSGHDNKKTEEEIKKEDEVKKTEEIKKEETVKPLVIDIPKTEPKKKIVQNTIQKQDEKKDEIVDPSTIIASATDSKTEIPTPYILGGTTILLGIGLFLRFYNLPK